MFNFLSHLQPDEVNFWQPGGKSAFKALRPGELFLFKLHSPLNFIAGGGFFVSHSIIPISAAWEAFGRKNGADDFSAFRKKVMKYRSQTAGAEFDPMIGCIILAHPFFLKREEWIPVPGDFKPSTVQGKKYDIRDPVAKSVWAEVQDRLLRSKRQPENLSIADGIAEKGALYGFDYLTRGCLGQGAFRVLVMDAYKRKCAVTGEQTLPVLESAHIRPHAESGPHSINNGLLLRADLRKLFDLGYMTITPDFHVEVSRRLEKDCEGGREYLSLHGNKLTSLPENPSFHPSKKYVAWHNENKFVP